MSVLFLSKNTYSRGGAVNVIPDAIHNGKVIEIKDVAKLSFSKQIEGEMHLAEELGYEFVLYVPKDATCLKDY